MNTTVIKIGGGTLRDEADYLRIVKLVKRTKGKTVLVVSALPTITNMLVCVYDSIQQKTFVRRSFWFVLVNKHLEQLNFIKKYSVKERCRTALWLELLELESTLNYLINKKKLSLSDKELFQSYGEKLSIIILKYFLIDKGVACQSFSSEEAGIMCYGDFENAIINEVSTKGHLEQIAKNNKVLILSGYYGVDEKDGVKTFGRGGTDYSACVIAKIFNAKLLFLKNTLLMQKDPKLGDSPPITCIGYDAFIASVKKGNVIMQLRALEYLKLNNMFSKIINIKNFKTTTIRNKFRQLSKAAI
jgi:aspartate kinase